MTVLTDLLIVRRLMKLVSTDSSPYQRGELPNFNAAGLLALLIAVAIGTPLGLGFGGPLGVTLAPFAAAVIPLLVVPFVAWMTRAKGYGEVTTSSDTAARQHKPTVRG